MEEVTPGQSNETPTQTIIEGQEPPKVEEAPKEETKVEEKKTPEFMSDKFAALSRKERAIVKARQELSAQKAEMEREKQSSAKDREEFNRWRALKDNAKLDPDAYLNEAGLTYGSLTERNLKGGIDPNAILEKTNQTIAQFRKEQEEKESAAKKAQEEASKKDLDQRVTNFISGIYDFVEQNKETYELIAQTEQQNLVWDVIRVGAQRGQELTVKQAAEKVEDYLGGQVEKALSAKKFKDRFTQVRKEEPKPGAPSLTNSMAPSTQSPTRPLTDKDRMRNAEIALKKSFGEI